MSLDPVAKEVWCEALRSGEFKQCKGQLSDGNGGHCCLGVAREVFPWLTDDRGEGKILSVEACDLLGIGFSDVYSDIPQQELAEMNDAGDSFDSIANFIEKHL